MRPVNCGTKNLFVNFSVWSERLRRAGALPAGVALAVLFALSAPSAQAKVEKITIAAIDDVVAGDEGWIIAIDDVAADAGGWITAIDGAVGARGGVAAYAAGAGGGFAAFGDITGGIAAFGQIEARLFDENGRELFLENFPDGKIPTGKPDERTVEFPSNDNTPTITDDPVDETGFISFAKINPSIVNEGSRAEVEILLTKPAPKGGLRLSFTIDGTAYAHEDVEFESSSVFVPEGAIKAVIPVTILEDATHEADEILVLSWYNNNLPNGWELDNNVTHTLTIVDNDAPFDPFGYPEDETPIAEDPATDITAINPNGEPPSNENTPTITNDITTAKPDDSNEFGGYNTESSYSTGLDFTHNITVSIIGPVGKTDWKTVTTKTGHSIVTVTDDPVVDTELASDNIYSRQDNFLATSGEISGHDVGIKISQKGAGNWNLENSARIRDVKIGIDALYSEGVGDINIINHGEIWDVRKFGIRAVHKGEGDINIVNTGNIKYTGGTGTGLSIVNGYGIRARHRGTGNINIDIGGSVEIQQEDRSPVQDVYMLGGNQHELNLYQGFILKAISYGASGNDIESKWDVAQGNNQGNNLEGFVDNGAYRYVLDYKTVGKKNTWQFYRVLTPTATNISNELQNLTAIRVDYTHGPDVGFWAHQNSLRSSDDSVHFGFNTPVMSFMGGDLSINNNIAPNLSASLVEGMSISNSIGLDYHFDIMSFSVSPQIELAWTRFDFDDFTGPGSTGKVSLEDGDIITSRLGLSFNGDYIYGGVNLHTPIDGKTSVNVSGVSISSKQDDFSVDGLLGFSYDWNEDYETYGELFMDADEVRANLGVSIDF